MPLGSPFLKPIGMRSLGSIAICVWPPSGRLCPGMLQLGIRSSDLGLSGVKWVAELSTQMWGWLERRKSEKGAGKKAEAKFCVSLHDHVCI